MKTLTCAVAAVAAALLAASPGTAGKGGPTPDPLGGWDGVVSASGAVRYVALPGTRRDDGRRRARQRRARAPLRHGSWAARHPTGHVGWKDGRHLGERPEARAGLDHEPPARSPDDLRRPAGQHTRGPAPDRALGPLGVRRDLPDGSTIYAVQYADLSHYSVRAIDTVSGRVLATPIVDKREPDEEMRGSPMTRAWGPGRAWAYTLYAKPNGTAFVHALDTKRREALCLDLPWTGVGDGIGKVRLQVSADGRSLVLRQPGVGTLATIDLGSLAVRSVRPPAG